ncbi:MAG: glycosyltransferase family 2 protein [Gluconacetobacter diazotrophicus]|nr:glycosyltransferase family 2 protein [Gluconacetobacter diazotrophicus]
MTDPVTDAVLAERRRRISPRFSPPPTPPASLLIHGAVLGFWILLVARAFGGGGLWAWSAGLAYIAYDTLLLLFVFRQDLVLFRPAAISPLPPDALPATTVIVAARNEAAVLPDTLRALRAQSTPSTAILLADDGSTDHTATLLSGEYGLSPISPFPVAHAEPSPDPFPAPLRWLRLPPGGKARALNAAIALADTELVLTIDADTLVEPGAIEAMRRAFAADPALVAATGVLSPARVSARRGRVLRWFQSYEYVRNFLSRSAWGRADALLLLSGAFSCFRRDAVLRVGGFDPDCLVEDYELTHRLRDHAVRSGLRWRTAVIGAAQGRTEVPDTVSAFLRQRRRWFGGFLQCQYWYRHMVGSRRHGALGLLMLPVKAIDTMQPFYGLAGAVLILAFLLAGRFAVLVPALLAIAAKTALDLAFHLWSLRAWRAWLGLPRAPAAFPAVLASILEPFSFQLLRHAGAALGWVTLLTRSRRW